MHLEKFFSYCRVCEKRDWPVFFAELIVPDVDDVEMCSEIAGLESRAGHRLFLRIGFLVFLSLFRQISGKYIVRVRASVNIPFYAI
jgi:hypothetical protein